MSSAPSAAAAAASARGARPATSRLLLFVAFFLVLGALWAKPERWMDGEEVRVVEGVPFAGASDPQDAFFDPFAAQRATPSTLAAGRRRERAVRRQQNAFFFNPFGHGGAGARARRRRPLQRDERARRRARGRPAPTAASAARARCCGAARRSARNGWSRWTTAGSTTSQI